MTKKQGRPHIGIYTLQIGSFSPNTATKFHGRRQPCRGILSCLVKKSLALECFAVLNRRFFFTAATGDRVNTGCIPRETGAVVEEKIHSKPCKSLCESAQSLLFFCRLWDGMPLVINSALSFDSGGSGQEDTSKRSQKAVEWGSPKGENLKAFQTVPKDCRNPASSKT